MPNCYGCPYNNPIHTCLPKDAPYRPRSEFATVDEWLSQNMGYSASTETYSDKREEIKRRLAELHK